MADGCSKRLNNHTQSVATKMGASSDVTSSEEMRKAIIGPPEKERPFLDCELTYTKDEAIKATMKELRTDYDVPTRLAKLASKVHGNEGVDQCLDWLCNHHADDLLDKTPIMPLSECPHAKYFTFDML